MVDIERVRSQFQRLEPFLDERGRRLYAANEAMALGRGGVMAVAAATGIARSTINRGMVELRAARNEIGRGIRRPGAGRKREVERQPGLLAALEAVIEERSAVIRKPRCAGSAGANATSPRRCADKASR